MAQGWTDALRALHPDETIYTFWDYFRNAFQRNAYESLVERERHRAEGSVEETHVDDRNLQERPQAHGAP